MTKKIDLFKRFFMIMTLGFIFQGTFLGGAAINDDVLSLVNAIQKRYYVIRRLERPFETLMTGYQRICGTHQRSACSLDKELEKVNKLWQGCLAYKHILDDAYIREFLMHIVLLYDALLKSSGIYQETSQIKTMRSNQQMSSLLESIDALSKKLPEIAKLHASAQLLFPDIGQDMFFANESEQGVEPGDTLFEKLELAYQRGEFVINTTVRFYMIQRMTHSVNVFLELGTCLTPCYHESLAHFSSVGMKSVAACACVERLQREHSLHALSALWQSLSSYRYIGDSYVIRECLIIVVHLYQLLMRYIAPEATQEAASAEEVMELYTSISSLPLPELLSLLDELTEQSSALVAVYHQGVAHGWQTTFQRYWWVPPVLVIGGASLYLRIKKLLGHTRFQSVAQPI